MHILQDIVRKVFTDDSALGFEMWVGLELAERRWRTS